MKEQKGFTLVEMLFWLAILALIIGGFVYRQTTMLQKETTPTSKGGALNDLNSERIEREELLQEK